MLTSKRFYFVRAWYEWMTENRLTPYIIVDAEYPKVYVPEDYIENGRITLNIAPEAVTQFNLTPRQCVFKAEFDQDTQTLPKLFEVIVPIQAIIAIYAQENKQGAFFLEDEKDNTESALNSHSKTEKSVPSFTVLAEHETEE